MADDFRVQIPDGLPNIRPTNIIKFIIPAVLAGFVILAILNGHTYVKPGEVAVIKNNITGAEEVRTEEGLIIHLPLGLTDVYKLNRRVRVFKMGTPDQGPTPSRRRRRNAVQAQNPDSVRVKAADGSNVEVDVLINYKIIPTQADRIIKHIGTEEALERKMIRSYTRALIREKYGTLTLEQISAPATRSQQNIEVQRSLNDAFAEFGVEVTLVNTTNFGFNKEYVRLVKEKKATAQEYTNQRAAQEKAMKEQEALIARAEREKETALIEARGVARKRIVEAENQAKQLVFRAKGEAYAKRKAGDRVFEVAKNEAQAIEKEGLNTAAGIKKLAEAYARGGIALVKETLAKKLVGRRINGRPYSLSENIERLNVQHGASAIPQGGK